MTPEFTIFYVSDVAASADFYTRIIGAEPVDLSESFAMFAGSSGPMLGLWNKTMVEPAMPSDATAGSMELCFAVKSKTEVDSTANDWAAQGVEIIGQPVDLPFGRTFEAMDLDGHRLRVYCPANR